MFFIYLFIVLFFIFFLLNNKGLPISIARARDLRAWSVKQGMLDVIWKQKQKYINGPKTKATIFQILWPKRTFKDNFFSIASFSDPYKSVLFI